LCFDQTGGRDGKPVHWGLDSDPRIKTKRLLKGIRKKTAKKKHSK